MRGRGHKKWKRFIGLDKLTSNGAAGERGWKGARLDAVVFTAAFLPAGDCGEGSQGQGA